jgi:hypothetical protein
LTKPPSYDTLFLFSKQRRMYEEIPSRRKDSE